IDLYLPGQDTQYFEIFGFSLAKSRYDIHTLKQDDLFELAYSTIEAVKTTHSVDNVGSIITSSATIFTHLVDGVIPRKRTIDRLKYSNSIS
ncbi:MAG: hypothetical protein ACFFG0_55805, partial [Candidatus Thorarchaeota archaeon]